MNQPSNSNTAGRASCFTLHAARFAFYDLLLISVFCFSAAATETNAISGGTVLFDRDVRPIFEQTCFRCHGPEKPRSDFRLDLRAAALKGGDDNTNDIVPGHSGQSQLIRYVAGLDPDIQMPPPDAGKSLTPEQVARLRAWIDEGAPWGTNAAPATALFFTFTPMLRWIDVQGDRRKFRELEGVPEGFGGGAEIVFSRQLDAGAKLTVESRARLPERDLKFAFKLEKDSAGFVDGGFETWRKYYDDIGGYYPGFSPSTFSLNRDLHQDIGRAWVDFGLTPPRAPQLVAGYEYQFRQGDESTLAWGTVSRNGSSKKIYPDVEGVNEHTHILKLDLTDDWRGWNLEDRVRVEFYRLGESRADVLSFSSGPNPNMVERVNQQVHYTQGADTFRVEKQLTGWWRVSAGSLYSRFGGTTWFSQNAVNGVGAPVSGQSWRTEGVTLERDSRVASLASLFLPLKGLSLSAAGQAGWTREKGFGNVDLDFGSPGVPGYASFPGAVNANQHQTEFSENFDAQFNRLPRTVLFAGARLQQESVGQSEMADNALDPVEQHTDALNHLYDTRAGFTSSPWSWLEFGGHYCRRDSSTGYNNSVLQPGNGYPGFITHRDIAMDEIAGRLALRPVFWLSAQLTYQWNTSDFFTTTLPVTNSVPPALLAGRIQSHIAGLNLTVTPARRFYFSGSFTYGFSRTTTADNGDAAVIPYRGDVFTVTSSAGFVLDAKTDLNATYVFSRSAYGQNNTSGLPLGLDFTRHELLVGLTRRLTKNWSGALRYEFYRYSEPGSGGANDFTAHGVFATLAFKWP
jgi:Planctomycete cytochrome C